LKKFNYSWLIKTIVFIIAILLFSSAITEFMSYMIKEDYYFNLDIISEESYYGSYDYNREVRSVLNMLERLTIEYKSEEHINQGGTIDEYEIKEMKDATKKSNALCLFLRLFTNAKSANRHELYEDILKQISNTWNSIDNGWLKVDVGFRIAKSLSPFSIEKASFFFLLYSVF